MEGFGFYLVLLVILALVSLVPRKKDRPDPPARTRRASVHRLKVRRSPLERATVFRIIDGDTVIVTNGWKQVTLRLDGIDCPENGQPWGDTAKYGLVKLIGGRDIRYEDHGEDAYGRTLATIFVFQQDKPELMNVNVRMVVLGHAWVSRPMFGHLPVDRQQELVRAARWAKSKRVGLWKTNNPVPPWEWRKEFAAKKSA